MQTSSKKCTGCEKIKPLEAFSLIKNDKYTSKCKKCRAEVKDKWRKLNKDKINQVRRENRKSGEEASYRRLKWENDPIYKENQRKYNKKYRASLKGRAKRNQNDKQRREKTINILIQNIRSRIRTVLKSKKKSEATIKLLGCSYEQFIKHFESLFQPGMTWENYGVHGWHIDHIIPCSAFDLAKEEEQKRCFHWMNLQPLWAKDNIRKGSFVADYQI